MYIVVDLKAILLSLILTTVSAYCFICGNNALAVMVFLLVVLLNSFTPSFEVFKEEDE